MHYAAGSQWLDSMSAPMFSFLLIFEEYIAKDLFKDEQSSLVMNSSCSMKYVAAFGLHQVIMRILYLSFFLIHQSNA